MIEMLKIHSECKEILSMYLVWYVNTNMVWLHQMNRIIMTTTEIKQSKRTHRIEERRSMPVCIIHTLVANLPWYSGKITGSLPDAFDSRTLIRQPNPSQIPVPVYRYLGVNMRLDTGRSLRNAITVPGVHKNRYVLRTDNGKVRHT